MAQLFSVDFETGVLFDPRATGHGFDIISVSGGNMQISAAAKHDGAYGCEVTPLDGYRCGGCKHVHNPAIFRQAFWFDPNGITLEAGHYLNIARNYHYDLSQQMYTILLTYSAGYKIEIGIADNTFAAVTWSSDYAITDDWHLIETLWQRGSPGSFQLWIDGVSKETITATNNLCFLITPGLGALRSTSIATTGTVYFDSWRANDDGSLIGA